MCPPFHGLDFIWEGRRLTEAEVGSDTVSYTYNIDGIRTSKTVGTETTEYFLEGSTVIAQKTGNNVLWFLYDADGQRIGFTYNDTPYLYVYNATGDVVGIVDDTLTMVVEYTYSPWGEILSTTGDEADTIGVINPFRYRGYYYDEETGLYYLNARYYDPETGRFINADVLVDGRTLVGYNLFAYCLNNPINYSDYNGNFAITAAIAGAFAQAVGITLIAILTYQFISYYLETPSGRLFTQSIADAMAGVADSVQNFASSNSREEEKENERDIVIPRRSFPTAIYRYGGTNPGNLTPRQIDVDLYPTTGKGLSFSTVPRKGAAMTTIEAVNATGVLRAVKDGPNHVSIFPVGGTLEEWRNKGTSSIWTITLKSIVQKVP